MYRYLHIAAVLALLCGCAREVVPAPDPSNPVGQPVLFSSGSMAEVRTKAEDPEPALGSTTPYYHEMTSTAGVPYMPLNGRFVCTMYYHSAVGDTDSSPFDTTAVVRGGTMATSWLRVNNNIGNCVYWNKEFDTVASSGLDDYGFDKEAGKFYWQNRLTHAFLALADYNKLYTNDGATTVQGKLKLYPYSDQDFPDLEESGRRYVNAYDLTRHNEYRSVEDQPDPILALTIMKPAGATQEANRVRLYFKHQFSLVQVNLKQSADNSTEIAPSQIEGVELLGITEEGYVCNRLNADGTVSAPFEKEVHLEAYTDAHLKDNKWGTSFQMFDMDPEVESSGNTNINSVTVEDAIPWDIGSGSSSTDEEEEGERSRYLKSYNAIAFGNLWAIRITWHEGTADNPGIRHISTFEVPLTNETKPSGNTTTTPEEEAKPTVKLRDLQSGMKYIYDLELRRGTLAVIRTEIMDWGQKEELVYGTDGTILN